jgi:hypothetical protein
MVDTPEPELITCIECGQEGLKGASGLNLHWSTWCEKNPESQKAREVIAAGHEAASHEGPANVRSERGKARRGFSTRVATPLEQIRPRPGGLVGGPAAYYINTKGATISEVLIVSPNGAPVQNKSGREVAGAAYHQNRMKDRGYEYVGPTLTREGAARLVEVISRNNDDFILDLKEQITDCEHDIKTSDNPAWRDNQRKRMTQVDLQLRQAQEPIDTDVLLQELNDIAAAHKLASMPAGLLDVIRTVAGDAVSANVEAIAAKIGGGRSLQDASGLQVAITNAAPDDDF